MTDQQLLGMHHMACTNPDQEAAWDSFSSLGHTAVMSSFPGPCNCAVASPDGQWVAVVGDAACLLLLHASQGYEFKTGQNKKQKSAKLHFGAKNPRRTMQSRVRVSPGERPSSTLCSMRTIDGNDNDND